MPSSFVNIVINDDAQNVVLTITNTSPSLIGLRRKLIQLVQPLFQHDDSRSNNDRYGLGLSIVDNICKLTNTSYQLAS